MRAAPIPPNETERLQALRELAILDSEEEHAYDDITRLAAFVCDTPIALISLLDSERQWFKSRVGLDITETPREYAFCAHAINEPDRVMVIGDATADPRFAGNPLVTDEPNIRFYAGAPLVTLEGHALGALCVIDREPRELSPQREEALSALSRQVMRQLELRRTAALLARSNEQLLAREWELEDYQRRLEAANAQLEADLTTDELTGLRNRRALEQALDAELVRASRQGTPVSVLLVDIDFFKAFNLAYLRTGGDRALRTVAGLLASGTRPYDVVARYDEDQFAILLPEADDRGAARAAERLRRSVETAPWKQQPLTVSVGAATAAAETDAAGLLKAARDALQHAKQSGRNLVRHATRFG